MNQEKSIQFRFVSSYQNTLTASISVNLRNGGTLVIIRRSTQYALAKIGTIFACCPQYTHVADADSS
jgi:hypothetical protein